jgi:hypothetical protein
MSRTMERQYLKWIPTPLMQERPGWYHVHIKSFTEKETDRRKKGIQSLPTDQDHWPVLHVHEITHVGVLLLFFLHCSSDDL